MHPDAHFVKHGKIKMKRPQHFSTFKTLWSCQVHKRVQFNSFFRHIHPKFWTVALNRIHSTLHWTWRGLKPNSKHKRSNTPWKLRMKWKIKEKKFHGGRNYTNTIICWCTIFNSSRRTTAATPHSFYLLIWHYWYFVTSQGEKICYKKKTKITL